MASTVSTTQQTIARFYQMLLEQQPDSAWLASEAARVDSAATALPEVLRKIYASPDFKVGRAEELAEAFFVLFERAPDSATFLACMNLLRQGKSLADIVSLGLGAPGFRLSDSGLPSHRDFVATAYGVLTAGGQLSSAVLDDLEAQLNSGAVTRGQLIANALESTSPYFHADRLPKVQTALLYLAAANREASAMDLAAASGSVAADIQSALTSGGNSAGSTMPYFIKPAQTSAQVKIVGLADKDLQINLQSNTTKLGGATNFSALYSVNDGFDSALVSFNASMLRDVLTVDASGLSGKGVFNFVGKTTSAGYMLTGPDSGISVLQGGNGDDRLVGGGDADRLVATGGSDTLTGGEGDDVFVLGKISVYTAGGFTRITDFGLGADTIDFSQLLGSSAPKSSGLAALSVDTSVQTTLTNGSVVLLDSNGRWGVTVPTASDVAGLFGPAAATPSHPFANPASTGRYVLITADLVNDAQVWLVNNVSAGTTISASEVTLVGQIDGDWNVMLNGLLPILK